LIKIFVLFFSCKFFSIFGHPNPGSVSNEYGSNTGFSGRQSFDADPDPTFYFDPDPCPDPTLKLGQFTVIAEKFSLT
jgi:hypothetical protein